MKAPHLHMPHFRHHAKTPLPPAPLPPVVKPHVVDVDTEPGLITFHYDNGARLFIWPARRLAHRANLHLPDESIIYLSADRPAPVSSQAELYLRPAYRFIEDCLHDHYEMIKRLPLRDSRIHEARFIHELFKTPFLWEVLNYDTP